MFFMAVSLSFAANQLPQPALTNAFTTLEMQELVVALDAEEEALHCKVSCGRTTASCWFCNCTELLEACDTASEN